MKLEEGWMLSLQHFLGLKLMPQSVAQVCRCLRSPWSFRWSWKEFISWYSKQLSAKRWTVDLTFVRKVVDVAEEEERAEDCFLGDAGVLKPLFRLMLSRR